MIYTVEQIKKMDSTEKARHYGYMLVKENISEEERAINLKMLYADTQRRRNGLQSRTTSRR